jgi:glucose/arabinose dehydrogenase
VYLTAGLLIASTYEGKYPNPFIYNIGPDLFDEINRNKLFGSIIQINKTSGLSREFASGFRGPSGIAIQVVDGKEMIWALDHGPRGGDELNLIEFNRNYGWPYVSFGTEYFEPDVQDSISTVIKTNFGTHQGYEMPKYFWTPSVAPSTLTILEENLDLFNTWSKNDLLIGTLKDNSLIHVKLVNDQVILAEKVYLGVRIRDITSNNRIVFVSTDDGRILTLKPGSVSTPSGPFPSIYPKEKYLYSNFPGIGPFISWIDKMLQNAARLI